MDQHPVDQGKFGTGKRVVAGKEVAMPPTVNKGGTMNQGKTPPKVPLERRK